MKNKPSCPTSYLRPVFNEIFKYAIGDVLASSEQVDADNAENQLNDRLDEYSFKSRRWGAPIPLTVTGRHIEECYGGIQCHYRFSGVRLVDGTQMTLSMQEFQLVTYDDAIRSREKLIDACRPEQKE